MKTVIIIPTYNEKENIGRLIEYLETKVFPKINPKEFAMHILVIDDSSPDGTSDLVKSLEKKYPNVYLFLNQKKAGLGAAYLNGMSYAADKMQADLLFEMDADFSHDPDVIPQFLDHIKKGSDFVIGSRYIKGGSIPDDWGFHRKLMSRVGNFITRSILWSWDVADWTTGYRAIKTELFQKIRKEMDKSEFSGYTWQIGFLHKIYRLGYKISEVPINFIDRKFGQSKIGAEYIKNTLLYLFKVRIKELRQLIKFAIVGTIGFAVNTIILEILRRKGFSPDNAAAIGAEFAIISNFILNNSWTFKSQKISKVSNLVTKFLQFNLASIGSVLIQKVGIYLGISLFGENLYFIYYVLSVGIAMVLNYFIYSKIIWKNQK